MGPKGEPDNKTNWSTDRRLQDEIKKKKRYSAFKGLLTLTYNIHIKKGNYRELMY
jgi:hypothetical protein